MKTVELDISFSRDYFTRHFGLTYERDHFEDAAVRAETVISFAEDHNVPLRATPTCKPSARSRAE